MPARDRARWGVTTRTRGRPVSARAREATGTAASNRTNVRRFNPVSGPARATIPSWLSVDRARSYRRADRFTRDPIRRTSDPNWQHPDRHRPRGEAGGSQCAGRPRRTVCHRILTGCRLMFVDFGAHRDSNARSGEAEAPRYSFDIRSGLWFALDESHGNKPDTGRPQRRSAIHPRPHPGDPPRARAYRVTLHPCRGPHRL